MSEKIKEFLDVQKHAENKRLEEEKKDTLIKLGLYEKVFSDKTGYSAEFPCSEYDEKTSTNKYYKKVAIDVSDEEYEEIKKYSNLKNNTQNKNPLSTMLAIIGIFIYIVGFIASFFLGVDQWGDISAMIIVWWIVTFIYGTSFLGFAEIIRLLTDIKNK